MPALGSKLVLPSPKWEAVRSQSQPGGQGEPTLPPGRGVTPGWEGRDRGEAGWGAGDAGETPGIRDKIHFISSRVQQLWRQFLTVLFLPL